MTLGLPGLKRESGTVPARPASAMVLLRISHRSVVARIDITKNILAGTFNAAKSFSLADPVAHTLGLVSSDEERFMQYGRNGSFDRYRAEGIGRQFIQRNDDALRRLMGQHPSLIIVEIDSWHQDGALETAVCAAVIDADLNLHYVSASRGRRKMEKVTIEAQRAAAGEIALVIIDELRRLGLTE
jgi:hypothetical protein